MPIGQLTQLTNRHKWVTTRNREQRRVSPEVSSSQSRALEVQECIPEASSVKEFRLIFPTNSVWMMICHQVSKIIRKKT